MSYRSEVYLKYVRAHVCASCNRRAPSEPHHCAPRGISPMTTGKGGSMKMGDTWTIPVCRRCHEHWHASNTYRTFPKMNLEKSDSLIALTQLRMMAHWIRLLDSDSDLF